MPTNTPTLKCPMTSCGNWSELDAELDTWARNNQCATFWWRDDDATLPGPKLDRLLGLTKSTGILLAVIPALAQEKLATVINCIENVVVGQHGYAHTNHAPRGAGLGAWELGLHRAEIDILSELAIGRNQLESLFGTKFVPVLIPPWNNIDPALLAPIARSGYCGLSLFGAQSGVAVHPEFVVANSHCDPVRWKNGAEFTGEVKALAQLVNHLSARRTGQAEKEEVTGVLTHHAVMDEESWQFCSRLEQVISSHRATRWCSVREIFRVNP